MATILLQMRVSDEQILRETKESIPKIEKWFEDNPDRDTCNVQLWYDTRVAITRGHVAEELNNLAQQAMRLPTLGEAADDARKEIQREPSKN